MIILISQLSIKNFAIIKNLNISFHKGLNIITGETGAGKSIIIEAVNMALGGRADSDYVRTGCDKATIQLVIDDPDYDEPIIITREIPANGKSISRIDDKIVTVSKLSEFCSHYVDIHGQYDNQSLLNPENHIGILDSYDINGLFNAKEKYAAAYETYAALLEQLSSLHKELRENARKKDFMQFELNEITKADPKLGEDEEIEERITILQNSEKIYDSARSAYENLYSSENSCASLLMQSVNALKNIASLSPQFEEMREITEDCYYRLEEVSSNLSGFADSVDFSSDELNSLISRQEDLEALKRKFGSTLEEVVAYRDSLETALSNMENSDHIEKELKQKIAAQYKIIAELGENLSKLRKSAAEHMENEINKELGELNFKNSCFKIDFKTLRNKSGNYAFTANGFDSVEFLISTNKGEALKPMAKIASGGEISRIMLAFKKVIGSYSFIPTFIFDEIDTGISGNAANVVGVKLSQIAAGHQIICITHLPQIAVMGDYHYLIEKQSDDVETWTSVTEMDEETLIREIARLSGSSSCTESAKNNAVEMIQIAKSRKTKIKNQNFLNLI